jgi:K+-sensing histidine kinase KdpD
MDRETEAIAIAAGVGGALALGIALIPFRGMTPAANFTFVFMALTIAIAEWGGRRAAVATALTAALSLDFFLTEPYMKLTIAGKDDLIAFLGLGICGLIAAAFGVGRERRRAGLRHLSLVHQSLRHIEEGGPADSAVSEALDAARAVLPVSALLVRDARGGVLVASPGASARPRPVTALHADTLLAEGDKEQALGRRGRPLPAEGGRLPLIVARREVGSLELWGTGSPASPEDRRTLTDLARSIAVRVALAAQ